VKVKEDVHVTAFQPKPVHRRPKLVNSTRWKQHLH
jgi:hypothetical protein